MRTIICCLTVLFCWSYGVKTPLAGTIWSDNFDAYSTIADTNSSWAGAKTSITLDTDCYAGKCIKWSYSPGDTGTTNHEFYRPIGGAYNALYIQSKFKIKRNTQGEPKGAVKFIKPMGVVTAGPSYANMTLNLGEVTNTYPFFHGISYGDGSGLQNDTTNEAFINPEAHSATLKDPLVTYSTTHTDLTPLEDTWYTIEVYTKYNANDLRDGEFTIWVDGVEYMHAENVKNRNNDNTAIWELLRLGDYGNTYADMYLYMDDVIVSDSYIGSNSAPDSTPPITYHNGQSRSATAQTITLEPNETATTQYCTGEAACTPSSAYTEAVTVKPGKFLCYRSTDSAGNIESTKCFHPLWPCQ